MIEGAVDEKEVNIWEMEREEPEVRRKIIASRRSARICLIEDEWPCRGMNGMGNRGR